MTDSLNPDKRLQCWMRQWDVQRDSEFPKFPGPQVVILIPVSLLMPPEVLQF